MNKKLQKSKICQKIKLGKWKKTTGQIKYASEDATVGIWCDIELPRQYHFDKFDARIFSRAIFRKMKNLPIYDVLDEIKTTHNSNSKLIVEAPPWCW